MIMNQEEMFRKFYNEGVPKGLNLDTVDMICSEIPKTLKTHALQIKFLDKLYYEEQMISYKEYNHCKTYFDLRKIHFIYEKDCQKG